MPGTLEGLTLKDKFLADYDLHRTALLLDNPVLSGFRESAIETFRRSGFPTKKHEEYRYLGALERELHPSLNQPLSEDENAYPRLPQHPLAAMDAYTLVLVNGIFSKELSATVLPKGLKAGSLADAIRNKNAVALSNLGTLATGNDPFLALNSALFTDGIFIELAEGTKLDKPVHILHLISSHEAPVFSQARILVVAGRSADARILQTFLAESGSEGSFSNPVTEVMLEENARISWTLAQVEKASVNQVNTLEAHLKKHARFDISTLTLGGHLVRNNLNIVLDAPETEAHLYGYYHPLEGQIFDNHTLVDHRMPRCESNELYKGVVDGDGTAIFNGKVFVRPDAQKTNAYQSNKNILLSDEATVNTKPQLEIYADDVKCSHGSSTGRLDPTQLFYLRARGISLDRAKALLLHAYAGEVIEKIPFPELRDYVLSTLSERLT